MRVYISSTSLDLGDHRSAVINSLQRSGHTPVCMEHHAAGSVVPKDECMREVAESDLYVGIFAWRYGFVPDDEELSITEMEYREAQKLGKATLVFLLDEGFEWLSEHKDTGDSGKRIKQLREELQQDKWVRFFTSPDNLAAEVLSAIMREEFVRAKRVSPEERALRAEQLEESSRERKAVRRHRVPVPIPEKLVRHFQDRESELARLQQCLSDKHVKMVLIHGRGGTGKTALVARLIQQLKDEGIIFLSMRDAESRTPDRILELLSRTLDSTAASEIKALWKGGDTPLRERLAVLFGRLLSNHRCLIVMDNMESVLDEDNRIPEEFDALREFIESILEYEHQALLIVTSRRPLRLSPDAEIAGIDQTIQMPLDDGLPEDFAVSLLRAFDRTGVLGVRDAKDETLATIARRCQCIPRTLESLIVVLLQHSTWTLETLFENDVFLTHILENPAKEVYMGLSSDQERLVMQAVAIYDKPVPVDAIRCILPGLPVDEILDKLVSNFVMSFDQSGRRYWLHPLDRQYVYGQIPADGSDYNKAVLHGLAAEFYRGIQTPPRGKRSSIDDILPKLDAIEHLIIAGQAEEAATLFLDTGIDEDLNWWGHYTILTELCTRLIDRVTSPDQKIALHIKLGKAHRNLGALEQAKATYESGRIFVEDSIDPKSEIGLLNALGDITYYLGDLTAAVDYLSQAEKLLNTNPDPRLQSENAGDLANVLLALQKFEEAHRYYHQGLDFSRQAGDRIYAGIWHGGLGNYHTVMYRYTGDMTHRERAIFHYLQAIAIARDTNDRRHESHWCGVLGNFYGSVGEFEPARTFLKDALALSEKICYRRMFSTLVQWLAAVIGNRIKQCFTAGDIESADRLSEDFLRDAEEIGNLELKQAAAGQCAVTALEKISFLADKGSTSEAITEGRQILGFSMIDAGVCADLGSIAITHGRRNGQREYFQLAVDAFSKGLTLDQGDTLTPLLEGRAGGYSLLGKIEKALADYEDVLGREPDNIGAALSRAEVLIWGGRYKEAERFLTDLEQLPLTPEDETVRAWLMCHALNLIGRDYSVFEKILKRSRQEGIGFSYAVEDIKPYLRQLDQAHFSDRQIDNAWKIQSLMLKS